MFTVCKKVIIKVDFKNLDFKYYRQKASELMYRVHLLDMCNICSRHIVHFALHVGFFFVWHFLLISSDVRQTTACWHVMACSVCML
jgi:hypothetical protein